MPRLTVIVAALLGTAVVACGSESRPAFEPPADSAGDAGAEHIHGLGINPKNGSLMIATHSGLFEAARASRQAVRVGDRRQDTMGFTVVGPDQFLGSGHPDLREELPPLLGLIRSDDAGRRWDPVSLLGEADFHVLRTAGARIYGVNATDGRLFVSDDGGRHWATRTPPTALVDLVAMPDDPDHVIASGPDALFFTRDAGSTWRPLDRERSGLLSWGSDDDLYLVDQRGRVHRSADGGRKWSVVGAAGGRPAALASHESELYVALHTNEVKRSSDGGRTWRTRVAP